MADKRLRTAEFGAQAMLDQRIIDDPELLARVHDLLLQALMRRPKIFASTVAFDGPYRDWPRNRWLLNVSAYAEVSWWFQFRAKLRWWRETASYRFWSHMPWAPYFVTKHWQR